MQVDDKPGQEDFGWYFMFDRAGKRYCVVLGYRPGSSPDGEGKWIAWLELRRGCLGGWFGDPDRAIDPGAIQVLHSALSGAAEIRDVNWHRRSDFDCGREDEGSAVP